MHPASRPLALATQALLGRNGTTRVQPTDWLKPSIAALKRLRFTISAPYDTTAWAKDRNPRARFSQYLCHNVTVNTPASAVPGSSSGLLALHDVFLMKGKSYPQGLDGAWGVMAIPTRTLDPLLARLRATAHNEILPGVRGGTHSTIDGNPYLCFPVSLKEAVFYRASNASVLEGGVCAALSGASGHAKASVAFKVTLKHGGDRVEDMSKVPLSLHLSPRVICPVTEGEARRVARWRGGRAARADVGTGRDWEKALVEWYRGELAFP